MLKIVSLLILAFAVSLDGFGAGVMYGVRKIRLPFHAVAIISLCSGVVIYLSMIAGGFLLHLLPASAAKTMGALILIGIGIWAVYQVLSQSNGESSPPVSRSFPEIATEPVTGKEDADEVPKKLFQIEMKRLGLVIQMVKTPVKADLDQSGAISATEAVLLGTALSLDSFGAGIGAALLGFAPLPTAAIIAVASGIFLASGLRIGYLCADLRWLRKFSILPGFVLIIMGILKLF